MFRLAILDQTVAAINPRRLISSFANNFLTQSAVIGVAYGLGIGFTHLKEQRNHSEPVTAPLADSF